MDRIILDRNNVGTFIGGQASRYAYRPELRARLDEVFQASQRSTNRHFVLDGVTVRAAQSTRAGAEAYMLPGYVLVSVDADARGGFPDAL